MSAAVQEVQESALHRRLWRGGVWVVACRVFGIGLTLVLNAILARLLSPAEFGMFLILLSVLGFCATLGRFGLDRALLRFLPESIERRNPRETRNILSLGFRVGAISATLSAGACAVFLGLLGDRLFGISLSPGLWVLTGAGLIVLALLQIVADAFRGFHELRFASIFDAQTSGPLVNLLFIVLILAVAGQVALSIEWVLGLYVVSLTVVLPAAVFLLVRTSRGLDPGASQSVTQVGRNEVRLPKLLSVCVPVMLSQLLMFASAQGDIWIAGAYCPPDQLALFGAARRLVLTISLPLGMINLTVVSAIPELYAQGQLPQLQRILQTAATVASLPSILAMVALIAMPGSILTTIFGSFYSDATTVLIILGFGQIVFVLTGSCGNSLMMTGHERVILLTNLIAAILLLAVAPLATSAFGITGLAIVSASVVVLYNLFLLVAAKRLVGVWTHASVIPFVQRVFVPATFKR